MTTTQLSEKKISVLIIILTVELNVLFKMMTMKRREEMNMLSEFLSPDLSKDVFGQQIFTHFLWS